MGHFEDSRQLVYTCNFKILSTSHAISQIYKISPCTVYTLKIRQISDSEFLNIRKMTKVDDIVKSKFHRKSNLTNKFQGSGGSWLRGNKVTDWRRATLISIRLADLNTYK